MNAISQGKVDDGRPKSGPPCGLADWCNAVSGNPPKERLTACLRGCSKPIKRNHILRRLTYVYLEWVSLARAMGQQYIRDAYEWGAIDDNDLNIIAAGVAYSGR